MPVTSNVTVASFAGAANVAGISSAVVIRPRLSSNALLFMSATSGLDYTTRPLQSSGHPPFDSPGVVN
jgi:hypothetical protein